MKRLLGAALAVVICAAPFARAQDGRPRRVGGEVGNAPTTQADEPITLEGTIIEVPVVVADRSGRYVPGLRRDDFALEEDGRAQQISLFRNERVPIHVALVLDTSSSTHDSLPDIQDAAVDFTEQLLPGDEIMVVSFDDDVRVLQGFTSDRRALERAIRRTESRGSTRLYDAAYETVVKHLRRIDGRKAMVLLSDGDDTKSSRSEKDAIAACTESDVTVYGIRYPGDGGAGSTGIPGIPLPGKKRSRGWSIPRVPGMPKIPGVNWPLAPGGSRFMETITRNSGGELYYARAVWDVRSLFAGIAEELRHVYLLGYSPSNPVANGGYRSISVRVPREPDLAVRHRLGYQAESYRP